MEPSEKWERLVLLGVFLSGAVLVGVGIYLSQIPADESFEQSFSQSTFNTSPVSSENVKTEKASTEDDLPYSESWCDQMMEKPNSQWQGDEFMLFSQHCLNPDTDTSGSQ